MKNKQEIWLGNLKLTLVKTDGYVDIQIDVLNKESLSLPYKTTADYDSLKEIIEFLNNKEPDESNIYNKEQLECHWDLIKEVVITPTDDGVILTKGWNDHITKEAKIQKKQEEYLKEIVTFMNHHTDNDTSTSMYDGTNTTEEQQEKEYISKIVKFFNIPINDPSMSYINRFVKWVEDENSENTKDYTAKEIIEKFKIMDKDFSQTW